MRWTEHHEYHYLDYKKLGHYLMMLRIEKFGERSRTRFVKILNTGYYRWDQSAYRKVELGLIEMSLDRLIEVCIALDVHPSDVIRHCLDS